MIRVFVVDDHPALRAGLSSLLNSEPGLEFAGFAGTARQALKSVEAVRPDVALVDYRLPAENGLVLCHRLKGLPEAPNVLIYSAFADARLDIPAAVAGAEGLLSKTAPPDQLLDAIRMVASGRLVLPPPNAEQARACISRLDPDDVPIMGLLMQGTTRREVADTLNIGESELTDRVGAMLGRLALDPAPGQAAV